MALTKSKKLRLIGFILIIFLQTILLINFAAADSSLPLSFCDSGDLQTSCVINDMHYIDSNENVFNANNLVITGTGKLASNISMDFLIELTGNLTIEPRGAIELGASDCDYNAADSGSKLTIIADVASLTGDGALRVKGSGNNGGSIINITANALLLNGNNIFYTENLVLDIANSFDIKGSAFARVGAGDNNDCAINFDAIETNESVNLTNETSQNAENKSIEINLGYNLDSSFDADNDGLETTTGVVDLTVKNTGFNWEADEGKLCTRWHSYSIDKEETTVLCYGNERCCDFIGLSPARSDWNETFYSYYGLYSATLDNLILAQVLYVDYNLSLDNPYSDIVYSEWRNLTARYYSADIAAGNVCNQKCIVTGFNASSYSLSCEANDASSEVYNAEHEAEEELGKAPVLINSIPNITINEGSDYAIDLSEYFLDEDNNTLNFDYYKSAENASIYFDENIAVIEPYIGFTGDIYMFFIANDSYSTANSNIFTVSVIESNATSYSTRQWQAFISAQLDSGFCDSGDLLTTCVISTTKKLNSTQNILNANNVVITNTGKLYNNTGIHFILNLTGNLTIMPGGSIELDGSLCSSRNCYNGGNLTIYADAVNLTADSLITANGANLPENKINKNNKGSGDGGVINISANAFYSDGSISLDGGSHSGTKWGNGGSGGTLNLDIKNGFDINGNVYARGGTGNNKSCGVISGHIGDGGIVNIVNKNANIISGVILANPGSVGKCLDGVYGNSEIYANSLIVSPNESFLVAGIVNATNIIIDGTFGPKENGNNEAVGKRNLGANMTIIADVLNLSSNGLISGEGADYNSAAEDFAGSGANLNIIANTLHLDGSINVDGGNHAGGRSKGSGGNAGSLRLDIKNSFDISGYIFARGGTADSDSCGARIGNNGNGGVINIVNKNANLIDGLIKTNPSAIGGCGNGVYRNSEIYAQKITINANRSFLVAGIVNASNITIDGTFGPKDNGNNEPAGKRNLGANLTIIADVLNLSSDGLISGEGNSFEIGAKRFAGAGANVDVLADTMIFRGKIKVDGGSHRGGKSTGNGGDAGTLNLDVTNSFDINGSIFARGGTGDADNCDSKTGNRGDGGVINITNKNANVVDNAIETNPSAIGGCIYGVYRKSEIYANKIIVKANQSFLVAGIVNASNITIEGVLGPKDNGNNEPAGKRNLGANLTIIADVLNLSSNGLISGNGASHSIVSKRHPGAGANVEIAANTLYMDGNINLDGGSQVTKKNSGNGAHAGSLRLGAANRLEINGDIYARGGQGNSKECSAKKGDMGGRGNGGLIEIAGDNDIALNGYIDLSRGDAGKCNNGEGGSASVNASNNLNLSSAARINTTGNTSGDINLKGSAVKIAGTLISSNSIGNSSVDNGTILIEFSKSLNISQLKSLPNPQIARYNEFGRVRFKNNINNFETISFSSNITINANMIEVDSKSARELNQSALINLYSLNGFGVLSINRNGFEDCLNSSSSDLRCTLISDRNNLDNVEFNVTSFTGYSVKPSGIRLESPANGTTDTDGIVAFKCSANGDVNLANITLYHNISGRGSGNSELSANFTFDAAGNNNSSVDNTSSWMISGVEDGIYSWNCLGYENLSSYAFADDDFMFMVNRQSGSISENTESTALASIVRYEGGGGCIYTWQCSDWTECSENGIQTRTCTNIGTCLGDYSKPAEIQDCVYTAKEQEQFAAQETPAPASPPQSKKRFLSTLTGAVISALTSSNGSAAMIALILAGTAFY